MTYTGHCTVNNALAASQLPVPSVPGLGSVQVPGSVQGVFVLMHGLGGSGSNSPAVPILPTNDPAGTNNVSGTWASDLLADNWVVVYPSHPEDGNPTGFAGAGQGLFNDVSNDTGHGARYLATVLHWWDHIKLYCSVQFPGKKVAIGGFSQGGYFSLLILANRPGDVIGAALHCPAGVWENLGPFFTPGLNYGTVNWSGMDLTATQLNSLSPSVPVMISYGTADDVVGWAATTTDPASAGIDTATFTGSQSFDVASNTELRTSPRLKVTTDTGFAVVNFTGVSSTTILTGCTRVSGSGKLVANGSVVQNVTDQIISNGQAAGANITRHSTTDNHQFLAADEAALMSFITANIDPLR